MTGVLTTIFSAALTEHGDRTALADADSELTYRELDDRSAAAGRELAAVRPGTDQPRVGVQAANSTAYVLAYLGLLRAGCVPFLLDRAAGQHETAAVVEDCGLDLLVHDEDVPAPDAAARVGTLAGLQLSALPTRPDRPDLHGGTEVCRFTSGSTGRPHCIEFSGRAVSRAAQNWVAGTGLTGADRIACFAALSNGLAFNTSLLAAFLAGAQLHLGSGLPTAGRVLRMLSRSGATRLVGFPALYESLVRRPPADGPPGPLRMAISSAAPLRPEVRAEFIALTGVPVQDYYGAAEAGPLTFARAPLDDPGLGQPLPGVSLRAGTQQEPAVIEVRSESMGTRYLNAPGLLESRTTEDGFYRTGDLGYLDRGSLVLTGCTTQHLNVGGRKIDAVEVVEVLRKADGVRDAVVLEVPDRHGTVALGAVLAGDQTLDPAAARRVAAAALPAHKVPSLVRVVGDIPRGSTGKPALAELRRLFETRDPTP